MNTAVVYYTWSGNTERIAKTLAEKEGAALLQIRDAKKPGTLKAYTAGCFAAMRMKTTPIQPLEQNLDSFQKFIILAPVWAGGPAPAVNNVFRQLPKGAEVSVYMVSASGSSKCKDKIQAVLEERQVRLVEFVDRKG